MAAAMKFVTVLIMHLLTVELPALGSRMLAASWSRTMVSVTIIKGVVYMAMKAVRAVEPGTRTDKNSTREPFGAIVAVGSTGVRRILVVTVRAHRGSTYLNRNLGMRAMAGKAKQASSSQSHRSKAFQSCHSHLFFTSVHWRRAPPGWLS
jgi:hypothetical protein